MAPSASKGNLALIGMSVKQLPVDMRRIDAGATTTQVGTPDAGACNHQSVRIETWNMAGKWSDEDRALLESEARDVWLLHAKNGPASLRYRGTQT